MQNSYSTEKYRAYESNILSKWTCFWSCAVNVESSTAKKSKIIERIWKPQELFWLDYEIRVKRVFQWSNEQIEPTMQLSPQPKHETFAENVC